MGTSIVPIANQIPLLNFFTNESVRSTYNISNNTVPIAQNVWISVTFAVPKKTGAFMITIGIKNKK